MNKYSPFNPKTSHFILRVKRYSRLTSGLERIKVSNYINNSNVSLKQFKCDVF